MKHNPLLIVLLLICLGALCWVFAGSETRAFEVEASTSTSVPNSAEGVPNLDSVPARTGALDNSMLRREQNHATLNRGGLIQVSSTTGLALKEAILRHEGEIEVLALDGNGHFHSASWRPGWRLVVSGHSPLILGETPVDLEVRPFREFRVTGVPRWKDNSLPTIRFLNEYLQARQKEVLLCGMVDSDWVMAMNDSGSPFGETAILNLPNLRPLRLEFPEKVGGHGAVPWSILTGAEPATLPLDCEVIGLPSVADVSQLTWDLAELTPREERSATYLVANGSWGRLSFRLPRRQPTESVSGTRARFEGVPLGTEVAVFAGIPNVGFGWTGPHIHEGLPCTLSFHAFPRARVRLLDAESGSPLPKGTSVRMNWMWGKTKTNILFNSQEMQVEADGILEWSLPVDAWSLPFDSPGPYPTKGVQIRVAVPGFEPVQPHMMVDEHGLADFEDLELTKGSWNLVFAHSPNVMDNYSYLFFGSTMIPVEGGPHKFKGRMPLPFSKAVPFGSEWSSIWMDGAQVNEGLRTVARGIHSQSGGNHFFRLASDGAYHRVQVKALYELTMSEEFLQRFSGWYTDVVYFAPAFSLGIASGWRQTGPDFSRQKFFGPKEDVFLKVTPPQGVKGDSVFFPMAAGMNSL